MGMTYVLRADLGSEVQRLCCKIGSCPVLVPFNVHSVIFISVVDPALFWIRIFFDHWETEPKTAK